MRFTLSPKSAFTLVEVMVVVAVVGVLAAVAVPNMVKSREQSQRNACISNLKQIQAAIATWALERNFTGGDPIVDTELYGATKYIRTEPQCPAGGTYSYFSIGDNPEASCDQAGHSL